jgi:drug/metabolite transporter (DMT)-like permease
MSTAAASAAAGRRADPRWAYALVNLSCLLWGTNYALGRLLRGSVGPFTLTAARFTVAALIFALLLRRLPAAERRLGRTWPLLLGMGITGVFGFNSLLYSGLRTTTAANAALISGTGPLLIGLMSALILRERFSRRQALGALASLAGVAVIASGGSRSALLSLQLNPGDLLVLAAITSWGVYSVMSRVATRTRSSLSATAHSTFLGLPLLLVAAAIEAGARPPAVTPATILAVVYIGIFPSVVAYLSWNEGVRRVGPAKATAFFNMLPVFGALFGVVLLNEPFGPPQIAGGALIIAGSLFAAWDDLRVFPGATAQRQNGTLTNADKR